MRISNYKVMNTPAGYYVGTTYFDEEYQCELPNSRDTDYMSKEEAEAMCKEWLYEESLDNQPL